MSTKSSSATSASEEQNVQRKERDSTEKSTSFINYGYSSDLKNWSILNFLTREFASQIHMIMAFEDGEAALIVTQDRMVYGIGENCNGRLGIDNDATDAFPKPEQVEALSEKNIKIFCYDCYNHDQYHVFALTEKGQVYAWGSNRNNELGLGLHSESVYTPTRITSLRHEYIIDIACSKLHTIALTNNGEVYTWGVPEYVQLTNDFEDGLPWQVKHEFNGEKIIYITCGDGFNMVISNCGKVYSWGMNAYGQLGLGNRINWKDPLLITSLKDTTIVKVACGSAHTLALTAEGEIYTWGKNTEGQLGHAYTMSQDTPIRVNVPEMGKVSDIAAQSNGSIAIDENGRVYVWGTTIFAKELLKPTVTLLSNIYDIIKYKKSYIIQKPSIDHRKGESINILLECLGIAFDDQLTSDLTIMVKGQPIYVHKTFLKIRCLYFRNMFQHNWVENDKKIIEHNQYSYIVYRAFLKYLYTSVIDLSFEKALELLKLADEYDETNLKRYCTEIIKEGITVSNVVFIYTEAAKYNSKELEEFCIQYILGPNLLKVIENREYPSSTDFMNFLFKATERRTSTEHYPLFGK